MNPHTLKDDELKHYKYLYKERVNGKWRYYYDVGDPGYIDGYTGRKPSRVKGYSKIEDALGKDERDRYNRAIARANQAERNHEATLNNHNTDKYGRDISEKMEEEYRMAGKAYYAAKKEYAKTPLYQVDKAKDTIQAGKNVLADWLEKQAKKLRK